jgi:hypothetical protein
MVRVPVRYRFPLAGFLAGSLLGPLITWTTLPGGDSIPIYQFLAGIVASVSIAYVVTALPVISGTPLGQVGAGRRLIAFGCLPVVIVFGVFAGLSLEERVARVMPAFVEFLIPFVVASFVGVLAGSLLKLS